ncbi:MAG: Crp/Fnr family transcriptional regulator [Candidatus Levybacteria bacterium]|nr:Crp/Fnr family transcriptional regulator [Candidatus Levybacteria bacterium]
MTIHAFFRHSKPTLYRRKERIVLPGDETKDVYYINQGFVRQNILSPNGNEFTPFIFSPQTFFPLNLQSDKIPDGHYYESITPVEIYKVPREKLIQFLRKNPNASYAFAEQSISYSSILLKKIESIIFDDSEHVITLSLLSLAALFGKKVREGVIIDYWFTHQDIALISGFSREVVTKQMGKLVKKKLISYSHHLIVINDLASLQAETNL